MSRRKLNVSDEKIRELRNLGYSYKMIANYFQEAGIKVSISTIQNRCKKIYGGVEKIPKIAHASRNNLFHKYGEEIYRLSQQDLSYTEIRNILNAKGVKISRSSITHISDKVYSEKGEEKKYTFITKKGITAEKIFELRESGKSYREISYYYKSIGIEVSNTSIYRWCKQIYSSKNKEEPKIDGRPKRKDISDEEVYELKNKGYSYAKISEHYRKMGVEVSIYTIAKRCQKMYAEKNEELHRSKRNKGVDDEELYKMKKSGMSGRSIMEYYNSLGIKISQAGVYSKCKKIFEEKGEKMPRSKPSLAKNEKCILSELETKLQTCLVEKEKSSELVEKFEQLERKIGELNEIKIR